ncbi:MAG: RNA polymerase sigma-54 factor [Candidatus Zixiibacteriota bacterium]
MTVERLGDEFVVFHNDRNVPHLRVNTAYRELLRKGKSSEDTKKYIREKLEQARWLVNAINQRRTTMGRVMEAIVEQQGDFFESGPEHLKPMTMESIAEKVGMNVATISRVASGKYVQTPRGVFEIRYFFNSGMTTDDGEELTKRAIKRRLEEIIKNEDLRSPLSDQEIANLLKEEGLSIARRTVTKYREELKIMPARFRKKVRPGPREKEQGSGTD